MIESLETRRQFTTVIDPNFEALVEVNESKNIVNIDLDAENDRVLIKYADSADDAFFEDTAGGVPLSNAGYASEVYDFDGRHEQRDEWRELVESYFEFFDFVVVGRVNDRSFALGLFEKSNFRIEGGGGDDLIAIDPNFRNTRVTLSGQDGNDTLIGGVYIDSLFGGSGDDQIASNARIRAHIEGNRGNDTLVGSGYEDVIRGGAGDDLIDGGDYGDGHAQAWKPIKIVRPYDDGGAYVTMRDYLDGGAGYDTAVRDSSDRETINIERRIK